MMKILRSPESALTHKQRIEMGTLGPENPWSDYVGFDFADEIYMDCLDEAEQQAPTVTVMEFAGRTGLNGMEDSHEKNIRAL